VAHARQRRAFTLLELILVLALIAMIMAAAVPSIQAMLDDARLQEAADTLRSRFAEARAHAIEEGRPYRFAIMPGQSDFRLAPDLPEYWSGAEDPTATTASNVPPLILEAKLPNDVMFNLIDGGGHPSDSGPWSHLISFLPDGSCDADCNIDLQRGDSRPISIFIRGLTGSVTVRTGDVGANR
jgi:prepilin-type N-terminal cleavage/methylation domain-containing protein